MSKYFSTWIDRILNTYPIGKAEAEILAGFDEAMAKGGIGTRARHDAIEYFLNQEAYKGRIYDFRKALDTLERPAAPSFTKEETDAALRIMTGSVADDEQ